MAQPTCGSKGKTSGVRNHGMSICCVNYQLCGVEVLTVKVVLLQCCVCWEPCRRRQKFYWSFCRKRRKNTTPSTYSSRGFISSDHLLKPYQTELLFRLKNYCSSSKPWRSATELPPHQNGIHQSRFTSVHQDHYHACTSVGRCTYTLGLCVCEGTHLNVGLEVKQIHTLPVAAIQSERMPHTTHVCTPTLGHHIKDGENPTGRPKK